eukprot:gb/GECG01010247.1/.p1 GENE.gb/GECG01010247.1/~~gb/GECG01010247.1/.p1  ORF type:complete len:115 (+),score=3.48 gb/GECG01010247.1/:1-345(+)
MTEFERTRTASSSLRTLSRSKRGTSKLAAQKISDQEYSCLKQARSVDAIRWALTSKKMQDPDSGSLQPIDVNKLYLDKKKADSVTLCSLAGESRCYRRVMPLSQSKPFSRRCRW